MPAPKLKSASLHTLLYQTPSKETRGHGCVSLWVQRVLCNVCRKDQTNSALAGLCPLVRWINADCLGMTWSSGPHKKTLTGCRRGKQSPPRVCSKPLLIALAFFLHVVTETLLFLSVSSLLHSLFKKKQKKKLTSHTRASASLHGVNMKQHFCDCSPYLGMSALKVTFQTWEVWSIFWGGAQTGKIRRKMQCI